MTIKAKVLGLTIIGLLTATHVMAAEKGQKVEPDYTKGQVLHSQRYISLGPIGVEGNIWATGWDTGGYTANTRTIQIRKVQKNSPAEGALKQWDVILGVKNVHVMPNKELQSNKNLQVDQHCQRPGCDGTQGSCGHFSWDVRKELAAIITKAEKKDGKLVLMIWRPETKTVEIPLERIYKHKRSLAEAKRKGEKYYELALKKPLVGKTMEVSLTLPVKGSFSATAPWDCEKTKVLIDDAAQVIAKRLPKSKPRHARDLIPACMDALGLLATGEKKYHPIIQEFARVLAKNVEGLDIMEVPGYMTWTASYTNLFLAEYYLATKDEDVMPGLKALSTCIAKGRSGVGTYGHGLANVKLHGLYGSPIGYGAMNQCSITCIMSLALAQKCGLDSVEINEAVRIGTGFLRWYADKGTIPYGDHAPAYYHDNNGRNSQAAVLFDLVGDKASAAFFVRQTLASHNLREVGHTGVYFASQWGALGAARGGPEAAQSFMNNMRWYTELERRHDGRYCYQRQLNTGEKAYRNWSTTGQRLSQLCLPRKALYITGKGGHSLPALTSEEVAEAAEAGLQYGKEFTKKRSVKELLKLLGSWSVVVRGDAAKELGKRQENVVNELIAMLKGPDRYARYGACIGLRYAGRRSGEAIDLMIDILDNDNDMTMRFYAVQGLTPLRGRDISKYGYVNGLGGLPKKAGPILLKLAAVDNPEQDATGKMTQVIAELLFGGEGPYPQGKGIEKVDSAILVPALKSMLSNPNGFTRTFATYVYPHLSDEQLEMLWGDIYYATKYPPITANMGAGKVKTNGLQLMSDKGVEEGIELLIARVIEKSIRRGADGTAPLFAYGKALESHADEMRKVYQRWIVDGKSGNAQIKSGSGAMKAGHMRKRAKLAPEYMKMLDDALKKPAPKIISIKKYIDATPNPRRSVTEHIEASPDQKRLVSENIKASPDPNRSVKEPGSGDEQAKPPAFREFRSADGSKTFHGQFLNYDPQSKLVSVRLQNGQEIKFELKLLHPDDLAFVTGQVKSQ